MVVPAWAVYLALAVVCAGSLAFPQVGALVAGLSAFLVAVRMAVIGVKPFHDEIEF